MIGLNINIVYQLQSTRGVYCLLEGERQLHEVGMTQIWHQLALIHVSFQDVGVREEEMSKALVALETQLSGCHVGPPMPKGLRWVGLYSPPGYLSAGEHILNARSLLCPVNLDNYLICNQGCNITWTHLHMPAAAKKMFMVWSDFLGWLDNN